MAQFCLWFISPSSILGNCIFLPGSWASLRILILLHFYTLWHWRDVSPPQDSLLACNTPSDSFSLLRNCRHHQLQEDSCKFPVYLPQKMKNDAFLLCIFGHINCLHVYVSRDSSHFSSKSSPRLSSFGAGRDNAIFFAFSAVFFLQFFSLDLSFCPRRHFYVCWLMRSRRSFHNIFYYLTKRNLNDVKWCMKFIPKETVLFNPIS